MISVFLETQSDVPSYDVFVFVTNESDAKTLNAALLRRSSLAQEVWIVGSRAWDFHDSLDDLIHPTQTITNATESLSDLTMILEESRANFPESRIACICSEEYFESCLGAIRKVSEP